LACPGPAPVHATFDPGRSTVTVSPATGVLADGHSQATITVTLLSSSGAPVTGVPVFLAASGMRNFFVQPAVTDSHGVTKGSLTSTAAGLKTITASVGSTAVSSMPTVQFVAGAPTQLVFQTEPANVAAGSRETSPVQVAIEDAHGNTVPTSASIAVALVNPPAGATLGGTPTVMAASGVATFADLTITTAGTGYTLRATSDQLPAVISTPFNVLPASEAKLVFAVQPSNVLAGTSITPGVELLVEDQFGNVVPSATDAITMSIGTGPAGAVLKGTTTRSAVSGESTFGDLSLAKAGIDYSLVASAVGLTSATSGPFIVSPGARSQLGFLVQPSAAQAGSAIAPPVQVAFEDTYGNVVSTSDDITVAVASGPSGSPLMGTTTVAAAGGIGSFGALVLNRPGTYTLGATAGALTGTSSAFTITSGPPARVVFSAQPSNATAGVAIAPPVQVELEDALGNLIPDSSTQVTLAIGVHAAAGSLSGTSTRAAVNGVATFSDLSINTAGTGYTLTATANAYAGATSLPFNISAGPPATGTCTVMADPGSVTADGSSQTQITVTAVDSQGNIVSGVSVALAVSGTANMLGLTGGTANVNGIFTTSLASTRAETKQITATIGGVATATTTVQFVAAAPDRTSSSLAAMPTSLPADGAAATTLLVTVEDSNGNAVNNANVQLSVSGSANNLMASMGNTGQDGTFSTTLTSEKAETKTVSAVVGSFTLSVPVYFTSGQPSVMTSTVTATPPSVTADGNSTTQLLVTIQDVHGNLVTGQPVTLSVSGSANTLSASNGLTDANGQFTATLASTLAETKTVTANVGPGNVTTNVTFVAGPPVMASSTMTIQPNPVNADGTSTTTITVTLADANTNPATNQQVMLTVSGSGNTLMPQAGPTSATGVFTATLASTVGEVKTVTATSGSLTLTGKVIFNPQFSLTGGLGTLSTRPAPVNNMQIVDDGLELLPQQCASQFCLTGGIVP
jgi:hypothetical protein